MHNPDDLDQHDWEEFQPNPNLSVPTERMLAQIEQRVGPSHPAQAPGQLHPAPAPVKRIGYRWVAAASVIVLAGLAVLFSGKLEKKPAPLAKTPVTTTPVAARQTLSNSGAAARSYSLPDGSVARLTPGSSLGFDSGFTGPRRDIQLNGDAVFTVTHDGSRPFTVHTKDIAVTALGTVFGVDGTHSGFTTVLLYSGKVVVKKDHSDNRGFADVYLSPGQQLTINRADLSVHIRSVSQPKPATPGAMPAAPRQLMTFTRQPLADIFHELQKTYQIKIVYDPAGVKNMDFTGTFNSEKETLESFLSTLCDLNELALKKTKGNGFSVQTK